MSEFQDDSNGISSDIPIKTYSDILFDEVNHIFHELILAYVEPGLQEKILCILVIWLVINIFLIITAWTVFGDKINQLSFSTEHCGTTPAENEHLKKD
ncbi:hypothetical protein ScPMuIL_009206 [Solemya velum]